MELILLENLLETIYRLHQLLPLMISLQLSESVGALGAIGQSAVVPPKNALVAGVALKLETEIANAVILQIVRVATAHQLKMSKLAMLTKQVVTLVNGLNGQVAILLVVQERFLKGTGIVHAQKALWQVAPTVATVNSTKNLLVGIKRHLVARTLNGAAGVNARKSATAVLTPGLENVDAKIGKVTSSLQTPIVVAQVHISRTKSATANLATVPTTRTARMETANQSAKRLVRVMKIQRTVLKNVQTTVWSQMDAPWVNGTLGVIAPAIASLKDFKNEQGLVRARRLLLMYAKI